MQQHQHAVNWVDGMKITRAHFIQQEDYLTTFAARSVASQVSPFSYGLLPPDFSGGGAFNDLQIDYKSNNEVEVTLHRFDAVTPGGYRITVGEEADPSLQRFTAAANAGSGVAEEACYIVLSIHPYERLPAGPLNPDEIPPRHPYARPAIRLSLIPEQHLSADGAGAYFVVVGRLLRQGSTWIKDDQFIPPCTAIRSHSGLIKYYENLGIYINEMQNQALSIVQKIKSRSQQTDLARDIQSLCEEALSAIARIYFSFRNVLHHQPPVFTVEAVSALANRLYNTVQTLTEKDKEEMLKYIAEWCDVAPSQFEQQLTGAIELRYEHTRIGAHMQTISELMKMLAHIFQRLNRLDYIGIRKENIVVREEIVTQTTRPKKGWSLLD